MARAKLRKKSFLWGYALLATGCASGSVECPDVSGQWRQTVSCSELDEPIDTTIEQSGCDLRLTSDSTRATAQLGSSNGVRLSPEGSGVICKGTLGAEGSRIEVNCPVTPGDDSCFLSVCCVLRWER